MQEELFAVSPQFFFQQVVRFLLDYPFCAIQPYIEPFLHISPNTPDSILNTHRQSQQLSLLTNHSKKMTRNPELYNFAKG